MKFFYINNSLCTACGRCTDACATGAIYPENDKHYINYDRCTSCGSCLRACNAGAVTVESMDRVTREMENVDSCREYIARLEYEQLRLREQLRTAGENLARVVGAMPDAVFVSDPRGHIVTAGAALAELFLLNQAPVQLEGMRLDALLPPEIMRMAESAAADKRDASLVATHAGKVLSVTVTPLEGGGLVGVVRNAAAGGVLGGEVARKITEAIEMQLATVQKIGFLLGEEVSAAVANLHSAVELLGRTAQNKADE